MDHRDPMDVLVVDDNLADTALLQTVFQDLRLMHRLHIVTDGEAALSFLHKHGEHAHAPTPDLVLLDLNLPKVHGHAVLQQVKMHTDLRTIPVMVFSSSQAAVDIANSYEHGANAYLVKPLELEELEGLVRALAAFWCNRVVPMPRH
ncbi:MAG TPA: response regulator [Polyangiales bacterium]|nr:response regulator [Polyangiales bacterium]